MPSFPATGPNNGNIHTNTSHATDINQPQPANNQQTAPTPQEGSEDTPSLFIDNPPKQVTTYPPPHPVIPHARSQPNHNQMGYASDPLTKSRQAFDISAARLFLHNNGATHYYPSLFSLVTNTSTPDHDVAPQPEPNIIDFPEKIEFPDEPGNYHKIFHAGNTNYNHPTGTEKKFHTPNLVPDVSIVIESTNKETGINLDKRNEKNDEAHIVHCLSQCRKDKKLPAHDIYRSYAYSNGASYNTKHPQKDKSTTLEKITYHVKFLHNQPSRLEKNHQSTSSKTEFSTQNQNPSSRLTQNPSRVLNQSNRLTLPSLPLHNSPETLQPNTPFQRNTHLNLPIPPQLIQNSYPKLAADSPFRTYITEKRSIFGYIPEISFIEKIHFSEINSGAYDKLFFDPKLPPGVEVYIENFNTPDYHPHDPQTQESYEDKIIPEILKSCEGMRFPALTNRVYIVRWGYTRQRANPLPPPAPFLFSYPFTLDPLYQPAHKSPYDSSAQFQTNPPQAPPNFKAGNLNSVSHQEDEQPQVQKPAPKS